MCCLWLYNVAELSRVHSGAQVPGICVNRRCLGSLLTLILTSLTCTWGAVVIALFPGKIKNLQDNTFLMFAVDKAQA